MKTFMTRLLTMALCLVMCAVVWPTAAHAFDPVDLDEIVSLTIVASDEERPLPGTTFMIYRVADMNELAQFELTSAFSGFSGDINALDTAEKQENAAVEFQTIATGLTPDQTGQTDDTGVIIFDDIVPGMYLVTGIPVEILPWAYTFSPFIVTVPTRDVNEEWLYDVIADIKLERVPARQDISVVKIWNDEGFEKYRPNYLYVDLYCDGEPIEVVMLDASNSWSHTFTDLSTSHIYTVKERDPAKWYKVSYEMQNGVMVIRNSIDMDNTPVPDIPATGTLDWAVPLLAGAGLIMFVIGWYMHRKWSQEHE